uniref:PDZ domain-containing protein n=1 Tax=Poecilia mexicana TaxID=48701 RepID=A0A3B3Y3A6_9TELE
MRLTYFRGYTGLFGEVRQVTLTRSRSHEGLGFSIRGGSEHGVGIYVSLVEPGSSAQREGLRVGDQIVAANDSVFDSVSHTEAVKRLGQNTKQGDRPCLLCRGNIDQHIFTSGKNWNKESRRFVNVVSPSKAN